MKRAALQHTKMLRLMRALNVPRYAAVGLLESLWHLTAREAPQGNIGKLCNSDIADALGWKGDDNKLIGSLVSSGWMEDSEPHRLIVHDWHDHADEAVKKALARNNLLFLSRHVETDLDTQTDIDRLPVPVPVPEPVPVAKPEKPSRRKTASAEGAKHSSDPRHAGCKDRIFAAYKYKNSGADPDWDGREGRALGMLLSANPALNPESIDPLLAHWARSDINHSDRPSIWIPKLSSFRIGPIDRFNKPKGEGNGQQRTGKGHSIVEAAESAIRELAGEATSNFGDGPPSQRRLGDIEILRPQPLGFPSTGSAQRDRPALPHETAGGGNRIP